MKQKDRRAIRKAYNLADSEINVASLTGDVYVSFNRQTVRQTQTHVSINRHKLIQTHKTHLRRTKIDIQQAEAYS